MQRSNLWRTVVLPIGIGVWVFLLLSVGSFHATDWPAHGVAPYGAVKNVCGSAGAAVAYYAMYAMGPGVFLILFFSGICLAMWLFKSRVADLWLRVIGLLLLSAAFSAAVHYLRPGTATGFPEGSGGIVGIAGAHFLAGHFGRWGTPLILLVSVLIGLLLTADELVLRTPVVVGGALGTAKQGAEKIKWNFPALPKLPALPRFVTQESAAAGARKTVVAVESPANQAISHVASRWQDEDDEIELTYAQDEPEAATEQAFQADSDPQPAEQASIPEPMEEEPEEAPQREPTSDVAVDGNIADHLHAPPAAETVAEAEPPPRRRRTTSS